MALSEEELKQILARANTATPGPWTTPEKNPTDEYYASCFPADEDFIGHAREDIPALLDDVERLAEYAALNDEYVKALNLITEISDHCPYDANEASYILGMV